MVNGDLDALVRRAQAGDEDAADLLGTRVLPPLRAAVHLRLGADLRGRVDTDEVLHPVLAASLRELEHGTPTDATTFLERLGRRLDRHLEDAARALVPVPGPPDAPAAVDGEDCGAHPLLGVSPCSDASERVDAAIDQLRGIEHDVVSLRARKGLSFSDIAEHLELRSGASARRIFRRAFRRMGVHLEGRSPLQSRTSESDVEG